MGIRRAVKQSSRNFLCRSIDSLLQVFAVLCILAIMIMEGVRAGWITSGQIHKSPELVVQTFANGTRGRLAALVRQRKPNGTVGDPNANNRVTAERREPVLPVKQYNIVSRTTTSSMHEAGSNPTRTRRGLRARDTVGMVDVERRRTADRVVEAPRRGAASRDVSKHIPLRTTTTALSRKTRSSAAHARFLKSGSGNTTAQRKGAGGSQAKFKGVTARSSARSVARGDDVARLSFMMYRLVKSYNITSVLDVPCRALEWIPEMVRHLEYEVPGFKYYCVVETDEEYLSARKMVRNITALRFLIRPNFWSCHRFPRAELAFAWHAFGHVEHENSWKLLKALQELHTRYVIVPHYPEVRVNSRSPAKHGRVNVRRSPYRFGEALRVISNVSLEGTEPKDMLFYGLDDLPR